MLDAKKCIKIDVRIPFDTEFMPNYQEMMNTTMNSMGGGGSAGSSASSFANFTSVNVMLKGFMELQKEQLEVEKAKAEASRAKLNLALEEDQDDEEEEDDSQARTKRSIKKGSACKSIIRKELCF